MRLIVSAVIGAMALISPLLTQAEDKTSLTASIRIGLELMDQDDSDIGIRNFGSRIIWTGERDLDNGLTGVGRVELGMDPDNNNPNESGVNRTRQLWAGLKGDFGSVKIGAQYAAFYDMVSSHTDIAWWGSCWTQFECGRKTRVLKYNGSTGPLSYAASFTGEPGDEDSDVADQIELGANYAIGDAGLVGFAFSSTADDVDTNGNEDEGGTIIGLIGKYNFSGLDVGLGFQSADEDFSNAGDDFTNITLSAAYQNAYLVLNQGDVGDISPRYVTLGYYISFAPASLMYFELQNVDNDDDSDAVTIARATYKYDFSL